MDFLPLSLSFFVFAFENYLIQSRQQHNQYVPVYCRWKLNTQCINIYDINPFTSKCPYLFIYIPCHKILFIVFGIQIFFSSSCYTKCYKLHPICSFCSVWWFFQSFMDNKTHSYTHCNCRRSRRKKKRKTNANMQHFTWNILCPHSVWLCFHFIVIARSALNECAIILECERAYIHTMCSGLLILIMWYCLRYVAFVCVLYRNCAGLFGAQCTQFLMVFTCWAKSFCAISLRC